MVQKLWNVASQEAAEPEETLCEALPCSPLLARLLVRRGVHEPEAARRFLRPKLKDLHDPFELPGMEIATERIVAAMRAGEKVAVFGDYDVDGVASTALLCEFFRFVDFPVSWRLPHRLLEGYGLSEEAVRELAASGVTLIITVDNGSSARREVELARELGVDVVVTDHHQPPAELPPAVTIVNPWLEESVYPFKDLAGVGVTFKLVWALAQRFSRQKKLSNEFRDFLVSSLAFVALGTICDVVPLVDENRTLAKFGLEALERTTSPGLEKLLELARQGASSKRLEASDVGYRIGPRINAAGRMGHAEKAVQVLLTRDPDEAASLVAELDGENRRRREIEKEILDAALEAVERTVDLERDRVIVLAGEGWHQGVIGIVAARLVDRFYRPTLLLSIDGETCRGSARSIPGVHICEAMSRCSEHLRGFGGHEMAAGCEGRPEAIDDLRDALNATIELEPANMVPQVEVDDRVSLDDLTAETLNELQLLEPHGHGNTAPVFTVEGVEVVGRPRVLGQTGSHLAFHVRQERAVRRAIAFGMGDRFSSVTQQGARLSLLMAPQLSYWQGRCEVELHVQDLRVL